MSNASLKEQLQAVASQLSDKISTNKTSDKSEQSPHAANKKFTKVEKPRFSDKQHNKRSTAQVKPEKPKPKWLEYVQYGVELLKAYFPAAFLSGNQVKPLKKGIKQDLVLRLSTIEKLVTEDKACMVKSLAYYVNTISYLRSVAEGADRIDLDGNNAGIVSAEEAKYSAERYLIKVKAKKSASTFQKADDKDELEAAQ